MFLYLPAIYPVLCVETDTISISIYFCSFDLIGGFDPQNIEKSDQYYIVIGTNSHKLTMG